MSESLITADMAIKVSSTLDKSVGKKYLIDNSPETCWTSQQGLPQYIQLGFPDPVIPRRISLTFQGGFVGTRCSIDILVTPEVGKREWRTLTQIFPEDVNRRQTFDLESDKEIEGIKLVFEESSDFFGRITVYDLRLEGTILKK